MLEQSKKNFGDLRDSGSRDNKQEPGDEVSLVKIENSLAFSNPQPFKNMNGNGLRASSENHDQRETEEYRATDMRVEDSSNLPMSSHYTQLIDQKDDTNFARGESMASIRSSSKKLQEPADNKSCCDQCTIF